MTNLTEIQELKCIFYDYHFELLVRKFKKCLGRLGVAILLSTSSVPSLAMNNNLSAAVLVAEFARRSLYSRLPLC